MLRVQADNTCARCTVCISSSTGPFRVHDSFNHWSDYSANARGYNVCRRILGRLGYTIASMIVLHHAKIAVAASGRSEVCAANGRRCRKKTYLRHRSRKLGLMLGYLRHRFEYSASACRYDVSRRALGRFRYTIFSMIALHHAKAAMEVPGVTRGMWRRQGVVP